MQVQEGRIVSLDIWLEKEVITDVVDMNITHNLTAMASAAGIYQHLWRPNEVGVVRGKDLIKPLQIGVALMKSDPERFKAFDAENGWGTYEQFIPWLEELLTGCVEHPDAKVGVSV